MKNKMILISMLLLTITACKKKGCTDETATNYNKEAKKDDNSCVYAPDVFVVDPCENYTSSFEIQTPNKGVISFVNTSNSYFRILADNINAEWFETSSQKHNISFYLNSPIIEGLNLGGNGAITHQNDNDTLTSYTYQLIDSLQINVTKAVENDNSIYYTPIEATFSGKYKYWGYYANGQLDTATVNITGSFNLCGSIE